MDVFSRTFLPAAAEAELPIPVVSRHMPVLRHCVAPEETAVLVARGQRPGLPMAGSFLLLLTNRNLVITKESRVLHRVQLHLATPIRSLSNVVWNRHDRAGIELAATAADGIRERLWLPIRDARRIRQVDALLSHAFRFRVATRQPLPVAIASH
ncbi:MAG TPA: hypothetical protein VIL37_11145 [Natronosporangium sp.]